MNSHEIRLFHGKKTKKTQFPEMKKNLFFAEHPTVKELLQISPKNDEDNNSSVDFAQWGTQRILKEAVTNVVTIFSAWIGGSFLGSSGRDTLLGLMSAAIEIASVDPPEKISLSACQLDKKEKEGLTVLCKYGVYNVESSIDTKDETLKTNWLDVWWPVDKKRQGRLKKTVLPRMETKWSRMLTTEGKKLTDGIDRRGMQEKLFDESGPQPPVLAHNPDGGVIYKSRLVCPFEVSRGEMTDRARMSSVLAGIRSLAYSPEDFVTIASPDGIEILRLQLNKGVKKYEDNEVYVERTRFPFNIWVSSTDGKARFVKDVKRLLWIESMIMTRICELLPILDLSVEQLNSFNSFKEMPRSTGRVNVIKNEIDEGERPLGYMEGDEFVVTSDAYARNALQRVLPENWFPRPISILKTQNTAPLPLTKENREERERERNQNASNNGTYNNCTTRS